ncbi:uncharacterized protein [Triticum aestivum]|uniref:uncharacterized protein n=1 Tax=Triticum aestivum TaxID=4565 RepID=UPI001D0353E9|nr:uncharacterized protein LOC123150745 [Triticum aestivum]
MRPRGGGGAGAAPASSFFFEHGCFQPPSTAATRWIRWMLTCGSDAAPAGSFFLERGMSITVSLFSFPPPFPSTTSTSPGEAPRCRPGSPTKGLRILRLFGAIKKMRKRKGLQPLAFTIMLPVLLLSLVKK